MVLFFENKLFRFCPVGSEVVGGEPQMVLCSDDCEPLTPERLLEAIGHNRVLNILCQEPQKAIEEFCAALPVVRAAGGLVENAVGEVLMIRRKGWPDLPKGHIDEGESAEQAAVREVMEETGLADVEIVAPLCTTRHFHNAYGRWEVKQTEWYLMYAAGESPELRPEEGEQITSAEWLRARRLWEAVGSSYSTIKVVFERFLELKIGEI